MARRSFAKKTYGRHAVKVTLDSGLTDAIRGIEGNVKEALRPGAHQAALVLYDEMRHRVPKRTGRLRDSIYRAYLEDKSRDDFQVYAVGPNKRKAPHWHLVEFGTPRMPPQSYIRASWEAVTDRAYLKAIDRIKEIVKEKGR